jgi:hypothetical protein
MIFDQPFLPITTTTTIIIIITLFKCKSCYKLQNPKALGEILLALPTKAKKKKDIVFRFIIESI